MSNLRRIELKETLDIGGDLVVRRLGYGAMRLTGRGIWGEPRAPDEARAVLRRAVQLGVNFIDTADSYGPGVSERLIAEALRPIRRISSSRQRAATGGRPPDDGSRTGARST